MLAKVNGVFRISRDIELKYLPSGSAVAKIGLVNSAKYKTQSGEQKEDTCFIDANVWGKSAEILNQYCSKGSKIYIIGELKLETWLDQQTNQNRSKHSIMIKEFEFLDNKKEQSQQPDSNSYNQQQQEYDLPDNEIPF